jgi:hypothetical protein
MLMELANEKGGVGKSTLAVHLAVWSYDRGMRVALLDTDKQRSSSLWLTVDDDASLARRLVKTIGGNVTSFAGHLRLLSLGKSGRTTTFRKGFRPHCPEETGILSKGFGGIYEKHARQDSNLQPSVP